MSNNTGAVKYTPEEIVSFAASQFCTVKEFSQRWIIYGGRKYYVFCDGEYLRPLRRSELTNSLRRDLARAPIDLEQFKSAKQLLMQHGTCARSIAESSTGRSYFDEESLVFYYHAPRDLLAEEIAAYMNKI